MVVKKDFIRKKLLCVRKQLLNDKTLWVYFYSKITTNYPHLSYHCLLKFFAIQQFCSSVLKVLHHIS